MSKFQWRYLVCKARVLLFISRVINKVAKKMLSGVDALNIKVNRLISKLKKHELGLTKVLQEYRSKRITFERPEHIDLKNTNNSRSISWGKDGFTCE